MATSRYLYTLIVGVTVPLHICQFECEHPNRTKREAAFDIADDLRINKVGRFIRATSQSSKQVGDVVMIVDISTSLNKKDQELQRATLRNLGNSKLIQIGRDKVRIAIIAFESEAHLVLNLRGGESGPNIVQAAKKIDISTLARGQKINGSTNFPDALSLARKEFQERGRNKTIKAAVLVTDGKENCAPQDTIAHEKCPVDKDCNKIAKECVRPPFPGDMCHCYGKDQYKQLIPGTCTKSAVFGEFRDLKSQGVTLAIIGVGSRVGKRRLRCWATEGFYKELKSYSELEKTVEDLVTVVIPRNSAKDCRCVYYINESCGLNGRNRCGRHWYINITRQARGGRPCPTKKKIWSFCRDSKCGAIYGNRRRYSSGPVWWIIFIILLVVLAVIVGLAMLVIFVVRKQRTRKAVATGVQPSLIQPSSVSQGNETPKEDYQPSAAAVGRSAQKSHHSIGRSIQPSTKFLDTKAAVGWSVQQSEPGIGRSAQPSTRFLDGKQDNAAHHKDGTTDQFGLLTSQLILERERAIQPGISLMPPSVTKWKAPPKVASQKVLGTTPS